MNERFKVFERNLDSEEFKWVRESGTISVWVYFVFIFIQKKFLSSACILYSFALIVQFL